MKVYNPSQEERAFLYQEAQDLAPLVKDIGSLSVLVEQNEPQNGYRVTFLVAPESMGLQIRAENANLFQATIEAKKEAERQLNALINALPTMRSASDLLH